MRWYRENLLMVERLGVQTDWAEKTKLAYAKLLKLLDPAARDLFVPGAGEPAEGTGGPPQPTAPPRQNPGARQEAPTTPQVDRQIL